MYICACVSAHVLVGLRTLPGILQPPGNPWLRLLQSFCCHWGPDKLFQTDANTWAKQKALHILIEDQWVV